MFSIKESIKYGWNKCKENLELVLFSTLLILAVGSLVGGFGGHREGFNISMLGFISAIFLIIIRVGYIKIFLRVYDGENPKFAEIFQEYRTFWRYVGVCILIFFAVLGGLIFFIIPGIILAIRFSLANIIVVDAKIGPIAAMKESYAITKGNFWRLLGFWIVTGLIKLLMITIPVTTFASIYVYRELSKVKAGLLTTASPQAV